MALVPTMGNLHDGHLSLLGIARQHAATVVASIFVNRLQFGPHEDFAKYPRTLERDCELLAATRLRHRVCADGGEVYPEPQDYTVRRRPRRPIFSRARCGRASFTGVCTVVLKFFNMVQPAVAMFGKKDYQQLLVIRNMVRQLALPIEICAAETVRDARPVSLARRATAISAESQRTEAAQLHAVLRKLVLAVKSGRRDWQALEREARGNVLGARGWQPDYVAIRRRIDLGEPSAGAPLRRPRRRPGSAHAAHR